MQIFFNKCDGELVDTFQIFFFTVMRTKARPNTLEVGAEFAEFAYTFTRNFGRSPISFSQNFLMPLRPWKNCLERSSSSWMKVISREEANFAASLKNFPAPKYVFCCPFHSIFNLTMNDMEEHKLKLKYAKKLTVTFLEKIRAWVDWYPKV